MSINSASLSISELLDVLGDDLYDAAREIGRREASLRKASIEENWPVGRPVRYGQWVRGEINDVPASCGDELIDAFLQVAEDAAEEFWFE